MLLLFLRFNFQKKLGKIISIFASWGIAPLISSVIFYYLIWFFPEKADGFYLSLLSSFWIILLTISISKLEELILFYKNIGRVIREKMTLKRMLVIIFFLSIASVYSVQSFFYPIVDNDSALYVAQGTAVYENKNLLWEKDRYVIINDRDEYSYNSSIRPGLPSFVAVTLLLDFDGKKSFQLITGYYYFLLFGIFLLIVYEIAKKTNQNVTRSLFFSSLFFLFSWALTRAFIFNTKENAIYFFALLSLYLLSRLISTKERDGRLEALLGVALGLNVFINLHGIVIASFIFVILFILSPLGWWERAKQFFFVFLIHLFFGVFELLKMFGFVFLISLKAVVKQTEFSSESIPGESVLDEGHLDLYQISNLFELYLKGKLQILFNIGFFGFYFWFFLILISRKLKELFKSNFGKVLLVFLIIYFLVVLDPFNLNKHQYAIVLWGSAKYATLVMLTSLIFVSVYADWMIEKIINFIKRNSNLMLILFGGMILAILTMRSSLIDFGLKMLLNTVPVFKNTDFYRDKIEFFYYVVIISLIAISIATLLLKYKEKLARIIFIFIFLFLFVFTPFIITNVGKIPLMDTFKFLLKSDEIKLENNLYHGDIYRVYQYAKNNLPKNEKISGLNELYVFNDYFKLINYNNEDARYRISDGCGEEKIFFRSGDFYLCSK